MSRLPGSRNRLVSLTYDTIAEMAGGITGDTARQYARRGVYDSRNLESVPCWVNSCRRAKGLPLIGVPTEAGKAVSDEDYSGLVASTQARTEASPLYRDPRLASYRVNDTCTRDE